MIHLLFTFVVFVAVMAMASVLFGGWVVLSILRGLGRLLHRARSPAAGMTGGDFRCQNERCRVANPPRSRFCRRCGRPLTQGPSAVQRPMPRRPLHAVQ